jgi:hypothetical protein
MFRPAPSKTAIRFRRPNRPSVLSCPLKCSLRRSEIQIEPIFDPSVAKGDRTVLAEITEGSTLGLKSDLTPVGFIGGPGKLLKEI